MNSIELKKLCHWSFIDEINKTFKDIQGTINMIIIKIDGRHYR